MRKMMMTAIALMALLAVGCQKNQSEELPTFTARTESGNGKTELVGNIIQWKSGDQVKVFGDFGYAIYDVTPRGGDPTWATLVPYRNYNITGFLPYRFVYPSSRASGGTQNNNTLNVTVPDEFSIMDSPTKYFPMYGESDYRDVVFTNLCGMLKIHMQDGNQTIREVYVSANENMCGPGTVVSSNGHFFFGNATKNKMHIDMKDTSIANGVDIMVPIAEGSYTNLTITIINSQFDTCVKTAGEGVTVNVRRNEITTIGIQNLFFVESHFLDTHYLIDGNPYEYPEVVDLGLPSGTKWAVKYAGRCEEIDPENYPDCHWAYTRNTYNGFSDIFRSGWDAPTPSQFSELKNNCTIIYSMSWAEGMYGNNIMFVSRINGDTLTIWPSDPNPWLDGGTAGYGYHIVTKSRNANYQTMNAFFNGNKWTIKLEYSSCNVGSLLLVYKE